MKLPRTKTIVSLAALLALALLGMSSAVGFWDEPDGPKAGSIKIIASPSILQPGTFCKIEVDEQPPTAYQTVVATYEGAVIEANDQGIRLDVREVRRVSAVPVASKVPFSNRLFRNVGIGKPAPGAKLPPVAIPTANIRSVTVLPANNGKGNPAGALGDVSSSPRK